MRRGAIYCMLFIAVIASAGTGCKKDHTVNQPIPTEAAVIVTTIAGNGTNAYIDGPALSAGLRHPSDVAVSNQGTIFIADYQSHRVRKIVNGQITTVAGNDSIAVVNGRGALASFRYPSWIEVDSLENLYILDESEPRIRKITYDGDVTTYAGTEHAGHATGDPATARFQLLASGIAIDNASGALYISDTYNSSIMKIAKGGPVTTVAGTGGYGYVNGDAAIAQFSLTHGIALDAQKNIYVADKENYSIRKITPAGVVTKFSGSRARGTGDGSAETAEFNEMSDLVADAHGNLYLADGNCVRKIAPDGTVTTIAGNTTAGYADGSGSVARFNYVSGLGIDHDGSIYVADMNNNRIRKIIFQ